MPPGADEFSRLEEEIRKAEKEIEEAYRGAEKKLAEYVERYLASAGMNKILLLDFVLPSADLKSRTIKIEEGGRIITRKRDLDPKDIQAIPTLRTRFYQILRAHGAFKIGEKAWAILPGHEKELVEEANEKLKQLNKIITKYGFPPRTLNLIEMYAPTKWVKEKIAETIDKYKVDLSTVLDELKNKEINEKKRRILASKASKLRRIIENLENQLKELEELEKRRAAQYINVGALAAARTKEAEKREEPEAEKKEKLPDYSKNVIVPVKIAFLGELPVYNIRASVFRTDVYTGLETRSFRSGVYLVAKKWEPLKYSSSENKLVGTAPDGSIVHFTYYTGSNRRVYNKFSAWFMVKKGARTRVKLKDKIEGVEVEAELENLVPLKLPSSEKLSEIKAEILNKGWKPSFYDPVTLLYYFWKEAKKQEKPRLEEPLGSLEEPATVENVELQLEEPGKRSKQYLNI